jgi:hypothetical protein
VLEESDQGARRPVGKAAYLDSTVDLNSPH